MLMPSYVRQWRTLMAKYTIDFGDEFEAVLRRLAKKKSLTKAEVLRRAVATYDYLLSQDDLPLMPTPVLRKPPFRDLVSAILAFGLLGLIATVTVVSLVRAFSGMEIPLPKNADLETIKSWVAVQKAYTDAHVDGSIKVFDSLIVKVLLPTFSAIVGFVVGSRAEKS